MVNYLLLLGMGKKLAASDKLVEAMLAASITPAEISRKTGIAKAVISRMINRRGWVGRDNFDKLAECIGLEISLRKGR